MNTYQMPTSVPEKSKVKFQERYKEIFLNQLLIIEWINTIEIEEFL